MGSAEGVVGAGPDVTVIVAVYNTMPYLTRCLSSLTEQSIGLERMEAIVVDDGSTDGSSEEIARFTECHPRTFRNVRRPHSGGPAAPSNRGLDLATGRYVFFLGADDHLAPEALERMVAMADRYGSDVVLCKMTAVGERTVPTGVFSHTSSRIRLVGNGLAWALSNTKLFRRELLERHGLRYDESMPVFSDQPFVLRACFRAARISVLADQTYYYAVRRADSSNITFRAGPEVRLRCAARILATTERYLEPGPRRASFHRRHFHVELYQLFGPAFLELERAAQQRLCAGVAELIDTYGDGVLEQLDPLRRATLERAHRGDVDELCAALRIRSVCLEGVGLRWAADAGRVPVLEATLKPPQREKSLQCELSPQCELSAVGAGADPDGAGLLRARIELEPLAGGRPPRAQHWPVPLRLSAAGEPTVHWGELPPRRHWWRRGRPYRLTPQLDGEGRLVVHIAQLRVGRAVAVRVRRVLDALR